MIPVATFLQGPQGRICRDLIWLHFPLVHWWQQKQRMLPAARASANIDSCVEQNQVCLQGLSQVENLHVALHYVTLLALVDDPTTNTSVHHFQVFSKIDEALAKKWKPQSVHAQMAETSCKQRRTGSSPSHTWPGFQLKKVHAKMTVLTAIAHLCRRHSWLRCKR